MRLVACTMFAAAVAGVALPAAGQTALLPASAAATPSMDPRPNASGRFDRRRASP